MKFRRFLLVFLLLPFSLVAQSFSLLTWNIQDLGRTKDAAEIEAMVEVMLDYDLVLIQEVVARDPAGAQAVARIADELDRTGANWDYRVSNPTQSPTVHHSERYAILWKSSKVQLLGRPYLVSELAEICFREPYLAQFRHKKSGDLFAVLNYHSRKHDDAPEDEIEDLIGFMRSYEGMPLILGGDFNLTEDHEVWNPLYQSGYVTVLRDVPTTLKRACKRGNYFNYAIDNLFIPSEQVYVGEASRVDFVGSCEKLEKARGISDHLPVGARLRFRVLED